MIVRSLTHEERVWLRREVDRRRRAELARESGPQRPAAVQRAMAWLEEFLSRGPRDGRHVKRAAAQARISSPALRAAREALGVVTTNGGRSGSTWRLP